MMVRPNLRINAVCSVWAAPKRKSSTIRMLLRRVEGMEPPSVNLLILRLTFAVACLTAVISLLAPGIADNLEFVCFFVCPYLVCKRAKRSLVWYGMVTNTAICLFRWLIFFLIALCLLPVSRDYLRLALIYLPFSLVWAVIASLLSLLVSVPMQCRKGS